MIPVDSPGEITNADAGSPEPTEATILESHPSGSESADPVPEIIEAPACESLPVDAGAGRGNLPLAVIEELKGEVARLASLLEGSQGVTQELAGLSAAVQAVHRDEAERDSVLADLSAALESANRGGAERENILGRLHEEAVGLRAGELRQAVNPLLREFMALRDDLLKTAGHRRRMDDAGANDVAGLLEGYADTIADILERHDVVAYQVNPGDPFDTKLHRALKAVEAATPELERTVVAMHKEGFLQGDRVLRPAEVTVYRARVASPPTA